MIFRSGGIDYWTSITKYFRYQYDVTYCSRSIEIDIWWGNQNNVNNNKMVFSADDRVLIKLLKQEKKV